MLRRPIEITAFIMTYDKCRVADRTYSILRAPLLILMKRRRLYHYVCDFRMWFWDLAADAVLAVRASLLAGQTSRVDLATRQVKIADFVVW